MVDLSNLLVANLRIRAEARLTTGAIHLTDAVRYIPNVLGATVATTSSRALLAACARLGIDTARFWLPRGSRRRR